MYARTPAFRGEVYLSNDPNTLYSTMRNTAAPNGYPQQIYDFFYSESTGRMYTDPISDGNNNQSTFYVSDDYGVSWNTSAVRFPVSSWWRRFAIDDSTGTILVTSNVSNGNGVNYLYRSTDRGATWTNLSAKKPIASQNSAFLKKFNRFICWNGYVLQYSNDAGNTWTRRDIPAPAGTNIRQLRLIGDRVVVVTSGSDSQVLYSDDGCLSWNAVTVAVGYFISDVIFGAGLYVAPISNSSSTVNGYFYSNDLINWGYGKWPTNQYPTMGAYGNGQFVFTSSAEVSNYIVYTV
jgi:hypothetical protein